MAKMKTILSQSRIRTTLHSKLPSSTKYLIVKGDKVRVFREKKNKWDGPFKMTRLVNKIISVIDVITVKPLKLILAHRISPKSNDADLKNDMEKIDKYSI